MAAKPGALCGPRRGKRCRDRAVRAFLRGLHISSIRLDARKAHRHGPLVFARVSPGRGHDADPRRHPAVQREPLYLRVITETITLAWIEVISRFLARRDGSPPVSALARSLLDACGHKDYLLKFYSKDVLLSEVA